MTANSRRGHGVNLQLLSGGQTGVDRAALDVALALGIPCAGWCPRGRRAADGVIAARYPLRETAGAEYAERTRRNVREADATLVLASGALTGGTLYTVQVAQRLGRPWRVVEPQAPAEWARVIAWIEANRVGVLNLAGPREEEAPGIYRLAVVWLHGLFAQWASSEAGAPGPGRDDRERMGQGPPAG
jgi:hypothetical protein